MKRSEFDTLHRKYMSKKLTINQLMALERLTGKEYTLSGTPRKQPRSKYTSQLLGITKEHHVEMKKIKLPDVNQFPSLRKLLEQAIDIDWPK
jgi:hypothetical protein